MYAIWHDSESRTERYRGSFLNNHSEMVRFTYKYRSFIYLLFPVMLLACSNSSSSDQPAKHLDAKKHKPGSSFGDTVRIDHPAAVIFEPDSLQLEKIRTVNSPAVFESMSHELEYQIRNARLEMQRNWPKLDIIQVSHARYLLFENKNGRQHLIDLDLKDDMSGIVLFDGIKNPELIDMMNIDTGLEQYFRQSHIR